MYIYIYIYRERERVLHVYIYIYIHGQSKCGRGDSTIRHKSDAHVVRNWGKKNTSSQKTCPLLRPVLVTFKLLLHHVKRNMSFHRKKMHQT